MDLSQIALSQMIKENQFTFDPAELEVTLRAEACCGIDQSLWSGTLGKLARLSEATGRILRTAAQMTAHPNTAK